MTSIYRYITLGDNRFVRMTIHLTSFLLWWRFFYHLYRQDLTHYQNCYRVLWWVCQVMMRGKFSGLECFEDLGGAGAWEVAEQLRISYDESREALTRHHQRLLNGRWGLYWLSNRGYERIRIFALDCAVTLKSCRDLRCKLRNMHLYCLQYLQIIQWLQRFFMLFVTSCTVANMLPRSVTLSITSRWLQNNSEALLNPFRNFMRYFRYYISLLGLCFYFWD